MPKPPPTSPTTTRTASAFRPSAPHTPSRTPVGIWLDSRICSRCALASNSASTVRGSIGAGATRWLWMSTATRTAARWNAACAAAASP